MGHRSKRGVKYRCNATMVLGVMFYDLYKSREGLLANKCCCDPYPGELFLFEATIDMPWISALSDERGHTFKDWKKMVDQEVRYMLFNKMHSPLMIDGLLGNVEFIGFKKDKGKVGVEFEVHLTQPHWDNDRRIETAFEDLITIYRNQSEDEKSVLGKRVLGKYTKRDYIVDNPRLNRARRITIVKEVDDDDDDLSGSGSGEPDETADDGLSIIFLIGVPLGGVLLLCIPFCIALRSQACLCRQCC